MKKLALSLTYVKKIVKNALIEDLYPSGDITSSLIKNNKIFLNKNTLINPITIKEVAKYMLDNMKSKKRIHEIGSIEKFTLNFLRKILGSKSKFGDTNINLVSRKNKLNKFTSRQLISQLKKQIN